MASLQVPFPMCPHRSGPLAKQPSLSQGPGTASPQVLSSNSLTPCGIIWQANHSFLQKVGSPSLSCYYEACPPTALVCSVPTCDTSVAMHSVGPEQTWVINYCPAPLFSSPASSIFRMGITPFTNG